MANADYSKPLTEVTFRCACKRTFSAVPERVTDNLDRDWHPWDYAATCSVCGEEALPAPWWLSLLKGWQRATGPKTPEGKVATAANLVGHPTPEEAKRTRFNAMKHGMNSRVATYFPAKPGKYAMCASCDVDWGYCAAQPCCTRQTGLFMKFAAAFERRDPNLLMDLYADQQAGVFAIVQQLMQSIIADGAVIKTPRVHIDKDGDVTVIEYLDEAGNRRVIHDMEAHPLLRSLSEFISRANLNMADMGMTQRVIDDDGAALGRLQHENQEQEASAEFRAKVSRTMEALAPLLERSQARKNLDPVLIEHRQQGGET